jgi:poly-gamma-glutamate synthesis protein (capsule biosynthesis protein)
VLTGAAEGRVLLYAFGSVNSGIPPEWGATSDGPGVNLLEDLSEATARQVAKRIFRMKQPGDVAVASIHWGGNWGYEIPKEQITFAHALIEEGVDIVHGHSSHHVKAIEIYRDRPILYGCGDFITDYEGITGHEAFRGDLALLYLINVDARHGRLESVRLVPMQIRRFRANRASIADAQWLGALLNRLGGLFGTQVHLAEDNSLSLTWR